MRVVGGPHRKQTKEECAVERLLKSEDGQGLAEYALIFGLIVVAVVVAMSPLGNAIKDKFTQVTTELS